jgi:hypothetical protein
MILLIQAGRGYPPGLEVPVAPILDRSRSDPEPYLRFTRRRTELRLAMAVLLGAVGLALVLTPAGAAWSAVSRAALVPVGGAVVVAVWLALRGRRWVGDAPEVKLVAQDEWQRAVTARATHAALLAVLLAQYPLAWLFGLGVRDLAHPRAAFAMAFSTVTLGLAVQLGASLVLDRE